MKGFVVVIRGSDHQAGFVFWLLDVQFVCVFICLGGGGDAGAQTAVRQRHDVIVIVWR